MKSQLLTLSIITCAVLCAGDAAARRAVVSFPAEIRSACAPNDGAALAITVDLHFAEFTADIFGRGLADLAMGKAVALQGENPAPSTTGYGKLCLRDQACRKTAATIRMPTGDKVKEPGAQGFLTIPAWGEMPEVEYLISPVVIEGEAPC